MRFWADELNSFQRGTARQERGSIWTRHCSLRPRNTIVIGKEISLIGVKRKSQQEIRDAVNSAAAERVETLFNEVAPFFSGLYPEIFPQVIKSNVLTFERNLVEVLSGLRRHRRPGNMRSKPRPRGILSAPSMRWDWSVLSNRVLGRSRTPRAEICARRRNRLWERFMSCRRPTTNLIHPSLSDFITRRNVGFLKELKDHNVIGGTELELAARGKASVLLPSAIFAVTAGKTWSRSPDGRRPSTNIGAICSSKSPLSDLDYANTSAGDHLVLADRTPGRLLRAARGLSAQLLASGYNLQLRMGAHSGYWKLNPALEGAQHPEISHIVVVAARIEPLAKGGDILLSQQFVDDARRYGYRFEEEGLSVVDGQYVGVQRYDAGGESRFPKRARPSSGSRSIWSKAPGLKSGPRL